MRLAIVIGVLLGCSTPILAQETAHRFSNPFSIEDYEFVLPNLCRDVKLTVVGLTNWGSFCDQAVPQVAAQRATREAIQAAKVEVEKEKEKAAKDVKDAKPAGEVE